MAPAATVAITDVSILTVLKPEAAEEALQRLRELPAVEGVGDEVAPGLGDALEPAEGLEGDAGEDLHERVVGEPGHRAAPLGAVHTRAWREGLRALTLEIRRRKG